MATSARRSWHAACPNCGAPVEFASAASASAVCGSCRSTLLRDGETLQRIGVSAELFDDYSPLQLGASGRYQGAAFTLIGRQQLGDESSCWNEWHVLFDAGDGNPLVNPATSSDPDSGNSRGAWLSEDNGAYVMAFDAPLPGAAPAPAELRAGEQLQLGGATWSVASVVRARVQAAEGELPRPPRLGGPEFTLADLRNTADEVATLDWRDPGRVGWSLGRSVRLDDLQMKGLRESNDKTLSGRSIECPNCGASLAVKLASSQSVVCEQCQSVVDLSAGVGRELAHYAQDNVGAAPQIPLGRSGSLSLGGSQLSWQVVGYVERREVDVDAGEEQTAWREYLLYHSTEGFSFLVDAEDGWSYAKPITGVPQIRDGNATWQGSTYKPLYTYTGAVSYVLGEFYWRLKRGERTQNTDFAAGKKRLNREQAGNEVTWSAGAVLDSALVAKAFGLADAQAQALQRDVSPLSASSGGLGRRLLIYAVIAIVVLVLIASLSRCGSNDCASTLSTFGQASAEYQQCLRSNGSGSSGVRTGGGSFGGFSSGGGSSGGSHK